MGKKPTITTIYNPAVRYVSKFLSNTIFARANMSYVKRDDLNMLFLALRKRIPKNLIDFLGDDVNVGCVWIRDLMTFKTWVLKSTEKIVYNGSLFTPLFEAIGARTDIYPPLVRSETIDVPYLRRCRMLLQATQDHEYRYPYLTMRNGLRVERIASLPSTTHTSIQDNRNFMFDAPTIECPPARGDLRERGDVPNISQGEHGQSSSLPHDLDAPEIQFEPRTSREKFVYEAYKEERGFRKWAKKMIGKLFRKVKRIPGYVSSGEEDDEENENREEHVEAHEDFGGYHEEEPTRMDMDVEEDENEHRWNVYAPQEFGPQDGWAPWSYGEVDDDEDDVPSLARKRGH